MTQVRTTQKLTIELYNSLDRCSVRQYAEFKGITPAGVRKQVNRGALPYIKRPGQPMQINLYQLREWDRAGI
ncbi:TPA: hypothetical protein ACK3JH_000166 [Mannheimia haemolytica]